MKRLDGSRDHVGEHHLASLSSPQRWVAHRLMRCGYMRLNSNMGTMWFAYGKVNDFIDPCNLIVEVSSTTHNHMATFRLRGSPDIHITRYLRLSSEDGWTRLEDFEALFLAIRDAHPNEIRPVQVPDEQA